MRNAAAAVLLVLLLLLGFYSALLYLLSICMDKLEYLVQIFLIGNILADVGHRAVVKTVEIRTACHDKIVLFSKLCKLFLLLNGSREVISLDAVYLACLDKLLEKLNIVEHYRVCHNSNAL